ncbi:MAG: ribonuclease III [Gemmatimonadota bacterium]|nr:MAG: ribonuclease III [Gemmatimonadota bacterium]
MKLLNSILHKRFGRSLPKSDIQSHLKDLQKEIGYVFRDSSLLTMALVHRSYTHMNGHSTIPSNERLEFLGDSVLNIVVTEHLYHTFPEKQEGDLTQIKSRIVSKNVIAEKAKQLRLGHYLLLGPGEEQSGGRSRASLLADGFEALLGAMFLDGGKKAVQSFLKKHLFHDLNSIISAEEHTNYKSLLLEHYQGVGSGQPVYKIIQEAGPDHEKEFTVVVEAEGTVRGTGVGRNKREAEQKAAKEALEKIGEIMK